MNQRSVSFDRAAEYYDRTRNFDEETDRLETALLAPELASRRAVLELGVGTGQVGLRLHASGVPMLGLDLSTAMLRKLVQKSGGVARFPIVAGDATRLPFRDAAFDGVVMRHVLHLIPQWRDVVSELDRVVARPAVVLVNHGESDLGLAVRLRAQEILARPVTAVGLDWHSWSELEREMTRIGAAHRTLAQVPYQGAGPLERLIEGIERNVFSWTWRMTDDERVAVAGGLRPWLEERYGRLDVPFQTGSAISWHAYDLG